jgi:hypothetical protein
VRYKLTEDFLLRASASNSFLAPALAQEGIRITTLNFNATGTALQNTAFVPPTDPLAAANGGLPLKPDKSVNYTATTGRFNIYLRQSRWIQRRLLLRACLGEAPRPMTTRLGRGCGGT